MRLLPLFLFTALGCTGLFGGSPTDDSSPPADHDGDGVPRDEDCDDRDATAYPGATEAPYDGIDQDCDGSDLTDVDGDGWDGLDAGGDDCDDTNPDVNPGAAEVAYNGVDDDCVAGDLTDRDGDGYDATEVGGEDCDDGDADVHPGALDDCGGGDEDCDGEEDEDRDADSDGFSTCDGDCEDRDASVNPDAYDVGDNGIDEDCTGVDKGNCGDDAYDESHSLYVSVYGDDCESDTTISFEVSYSRTSGWQLPEDATCSGSTATFDNSMGLDDSCFTSGEEVSISGTFTLNLSTGCGTFGGSGSNCDYVHCDSVEGDIGFSQSCI